MYVQGHPSVVINRIAPVCDIETALLEYRTPQEKHHVEFGLYVSKIPDQRIVQQAQLSLLGVISPTVQLDDCVVRCSLQPQQSH